jgi:enamine deaminase RidA (YjgF/YER057c/UK114 family)
VKAEERLVRLGLDLPPAPKPVASYVPLVFAGGGLMSLTAFVSGQVPIEDGKLLWTGKVGRELDVATGAKAARRCGLQILAVLRAELGSLDRVVRVARVGAFIASADGFTDQPKVANGASDLFVEVFGDRGRHARAAVGVNELPLGAPVEVEGTFVVRAPLLRRRWAASPGSR